MNNPAVGSSTDISKTNAHLPASGEVRLEFSAPETFAAPPAEYDLRNVEQTHYLVDGKLIKWDGPMQEVYSPVLLDPESPTGLRRLGSYPALGPEQARAALEAATRAYDDGLGDWPQRTTEERIACVETFLGLMKQKREEVVSLLMVEIAKTRKDSEREFDRTIEYLEKTIEEVRRLEKEGTESRAIDGFNISQGLGDIGGVLCMGPYNYPLNETLTTVIPSMLIGNTVVMKQPKAGVLLYTPLQEAFQKSFPPGTINIISGEGRTIVPPLMSSPEVKGFVFIGSTSVANSLTGLHPARNQLRTVLGLGAKNPAFILPGTDLDSVLPEILSGSLSFNGQRCTALKTIFVHESQADEFVKKLAEKMDAMKVGMPWEKGVEQTPMAELDKTQYLKELENDARAKGAQIFNKRGGMVNGNIYYPTLLYPVTPDMEIYRKEQFGPIVPVVVYKDTKELIKYQAKARFKQQVSVFGRKGPELHKMAKTMAGLCCRVNINCRCDRGPDVIAFSGKGDSALGEVSIAGFLKEMSAPRVISERIKQ